MIYEERLLSMGPEIKKMEQFMEQRPDVSAPALLMDRLSDISVYIARSGTMLCDAKYILISQKEEILDVLADKLKDMKATMAAQYISAKTKDAEKAVNRLDRINRELFHQSEILRTQISFIKNEMNQNI